MTTIQDPLKILLQGTSCAYDSSSAVALSVSGYVDIESGDEDALQEAVYTIGPISAAINAQESDFILYEGGQYILVFEVTTQLGKSMINTSRLYRYCSYQQSNEIKEKVRESVTFLSNTLSNLGSD